MFFARLTISKARCFFVRLTISEARCFFVRLTIRQFKKWDSSPTNLLRSFMAFHIFKNGFYFSISTGRVSDYGKMSHYFS